MMLGRYGCRETRMDTYLLTECLINSNQEDIENLSLEN